MEADSGFVRNIRSPGSSDLVIKVNGQDADRYDEEQEESMILNFSSFSFSLFLYRYKFTVMFLGLLATRKFPVTDRILAYN